MKVDQLMTGDVATIAAGASLKEAARTMVDKKISGLPVIDDEGRLVGIVTEGDILHQETLRNPSKSFRGLFRQPDDFSATVGEAMTEDVVTIRMGSDHTEAARLMESTGVKRLPVVDPHGRLVGIISRSDVLKIFGRADTEITTEVVSEVIERILWLDPQTVSVSVDEGRVELTGRVPTRSDIRILEEMAKRVDGVVNVDASGLAFDEDDTRRPG